MREERVDYKQSNHKNDKNLDIINNIIFVIITSVTSLLTCLHFKIYYKLLLCSILTIHIMKLIFIIFTDYFIFTLLRIISPDAYEKTCVQESTNTNFVSPNRHRAEIRTRVIQTDIFWRDIRV
uniref:Uncharacterized protein n=1 Tax=Schizaphis graminum TaxID=13262 RepID=A0A2S2PB48_SCHGA